MFEQASTSADFNDPPEQWTSREDVALLKAVERFNMGNWLVVNYWPLGTLLFGASAV